MASRTGTIPKAVAVMCAVLLPVSLGLAQDQGWQQAPPPQDYGPQQAQGAPLMSPEQLDDLVAPVALYPDPLLSQVLAASTYPLEIVEANQFLQNNRNLRGQQLMDAARQQNWDASVQAMVAFPNALNLLASNVQWTTDLGNAFLAQQTDVMDAVQRMRARARANGRLNSTPQENVTTDMVDGQSAIEVLPANPEVIYVPVYDPAYVWGPPVWGVYPSLWYPPGFGFGFGFGPGIFMSSFFPGWGGWGGWGWGCGWFGSGLFVNALFFNHYGFHGYYGGRWEGRGFDRFGGSRFGGERMAWAHDPGHRMGVAYPNRTVASRFGSSSFVGNRGGAFQNRGQFSGSNRGATDGWQRFGGANRGASPAFNNGGARNGAVNGFNANRGASNFNGASRYGSPNNFNGASRYAAPNNFNGAARRGSYSAPASNAPANRGYGGGQSFRSAPSYNAPSARSYGSPSYSPRTFSAPANNGRAYAAPAFNRSFAAPQARQNFSAPRQNFSASRSFSAPRQNFSAPHFSGGGGGGGGGGHFGGGGGGGGAHFSGGGGGHSGGGGNSGGGHHR